MAGAGRSGRLSAHFTAAELACPHCGVTLARARLVTLLERIRSHVGGPLPIVSVYRCPVHNKQVGGAVDSMHMYGAAADLRRSTLRLQDAFDLGAVGVGTAGEWAVHVDVRDGERAHWVY